MAGGCRANAAVPANSANATAEMVEIPEMLVPRMPTETGHCPFWLRRCSCVRRVKPAPAAGLNQA